MTRDKFEGCLLGLALGDALGAPYEGGVVERLLWRAIGTTRDGRLRWTDDTQMALDIAESLAAHGALAPDDLARRFAASYRWSRGYGPGVARVLKRIRRGADWRQASRSVYPEGSWGNGGAMRAPAIGLFYARRLHELPAAARLSAAITHAHPEGMEGAVLLATATALALNGRPAPDILRGAAAECAQPAFTARLNLAAGWMQSGAQPAAPEVAARLGNGIAASASCVTALYLALRCLDRPFLEMQDFAVRLRGDVDTISAMAGAVWGAANGAARLPREQLLKLEQVERLVRAAAALLARVSA